MVADCKEITVFTLTDTPVKFVGLLALFVFTTVWSLYQLSRRQSGPTLVSNLAHLAMSVVMLLMVSRTLWQPFVAAIPLPLLVGFFGAFTVWFIVLGVRGLGAPRDLTRKHGWHALGHAGMFWAMTWHLTAMLVRMQTMTVDAMGHGHGAGDMAGGPGTMATPGMDGMGHGQMSQSPMATTNMPGSDQAMLVAVIGVPFMAYLLIAAIGNLKNAISPSADILDRVGHELAGHGHYAVGNPRIGALADFAMNFGMFWMSTGLMVPLLPSFGVFAF
jgi:hypothetical protein